MTTGAKNNKFNIIQLNVGRSRLAVDSLIYYVTNNDIDLIMIQEPPYNRASGQVSVKINDYLLYYHKSKTDKIVKACILVKKTFNTILLTQYTTHNIVTLSLNSIYKFCCIYVEPLNDDNDTLSKFEDIIQNFSNQKFMVCGDFNARSRYWDEGSPNKRGELLEQIIDANNLYLINTCLRPTFQSYAMGKSRTSVVDLVLVSPSFHNYVKTYKYNNAFPTEHVAIVTQIGESFQHSEHIMYRKYKTSTTNWQKFKDVLVENTLELISVNSIIDDVDQLELAVEGFVAAVQLTCDQTMPKKRGNISPSSSNKDKPHKPWWTREISLQYKYVKHLKKRVTKDLRTNPDAFRIYSDERLKLKSDINSAKSKCWQDFCQSNNSNDPWHGIYRILFRNRSFSPPQTLEDEDGDMMTNSYNSAKALVQYFFPADSEITDNTFNIDIRNSSKIPYQPSNHDCEPPFTSHEIHQAIHSFSPKKAPGPDYITNDIFQHTYDALQEFVDLLYNSCLRLKHFPTQWKTCKTIVLPKPNKQNYVSVKNYRPIGLLSVFGKALEKLIQNRLQWILIRSSLFSKSQYGFIPGKSAERALNNLKTEIIKRRKAKLTTVMLTLDIRGAFDNTWWPLLLCELKRYGLSSQLYDLILHYHKDRKAILTYAGETIIESLTKGHTQGSVLGPTMWNIIANTLLEKLQPLEKLNIFSQAYADDFTILISDKNAAKLEDKISIVNNIITNWALDVKIHFAPNKTEAMVFKHYYASVIPNIKILGRTIEPSSSVKILGVYFDTSLTFAAHVRYIIDKLKSSLHKIYSISRPTWGSSPLILKLIYNGAILPAIAYCSSVWIEAARKKTYQKLLTSFQRNILLRIAKAYRTVSFHSLCAITNILPIYLYIQERADIYNIAYSSSFPRHIVNFAEMNHLQTTLSPKIPISDKPYPSFAPTFNIVINPRVRTADDFVDRYSYYLDNTICIYSDGSKQDKGTGCAFVVYTPQKTKLVQQSFKLADHCNIYQTELYAIDRAFAWIASNSHPTSTSRYRNKIRNTSEITLFTDSESALRAIQNPQNNHELVHDIQNTISNLQSVYHKTITMVWLKSHVGIDGNEYVDTLAGRAALRKTSITYDKFSLQYAKNIVNTYYRHVWAEMYLETTKAAVTKRFIPNISSKAVDGFPIEHINYYNTQFLTGHGKFNHYLHRFKIIDSPICPCDGEAIQNVEHLLISCPILYRHRLQLSLQIPDQDFSIYNLFFSPYASSFSKFLRDAHRML